MTDEYEDDDEVEEVPSDEEDTGHLEQTLEELDELRGEIQHEVNRREIEKTVNDEFKQTGRKDPYRI